MQRRMTDENGLVIKALNGCWRCSAFLLCDPGWLEAMQKAGAPVYCPRCKKIMDAEQAKIPCLPGYRAVHADYQRGPFADLVITQVSGERVTVSVLGWPDADDAVLARWWPPVMHGRRVFFRGELVMKGR